jgi:hypothetical protein
MADMLEIGAQDMRLPERANEVLDEGGRVQVKRYGRPSRVVLSWDKFALVAPLLDLIEEGAVMSPEMLMSTTDIELARDLAGDREASEAEDAAIARMVDAKG